MPEAHNVCEAATLRQWPNDPTLITQAFKVLAGEGARGNPRKVAPNKKHGIVTSVDRGCWQLNSHFHPEVSVEQAFDPDFAAKKALEIYRGRGNKWSAWCSADKMLGVPSC